MIVFAVDNSGSQGPYTPLSFLLVSIHLVLLTLYFKVFSQPYSLSFYQHFANTFIISFISHFRFFFILSDICEEEVNTIGAEKLNGGLIAIKPTSLSSVRPQASKLYRSPSHIPLRLHSFHPSLSIRLDHFLGSSLPLLSAYIRLLS